MNIESLIKNDFSGAVSVQKDEQVLFQRAYGHADLPNKLPNKLDTKFATASAGKVFVAVGILQLIETGKLALESKLGNLFDFDLKQIDPNITIRQLLNHTSGIPDYFDESIMEEYAELWVDFPNYRIRKSSDLLPLFIDKPMMYPAGEKFQYNNTGFVVLGLVIEKLTGLPFDVYLAQNIFLPCEMLDTGYYELDRLPANCANAYIYDETRQEYYTNIYSVDAKGSGAGGAFTTVLDIDKFWRGLLNGRLLSPRSLYEMLSVQSGDDDNQYGYGIWLKQTAENACQPYFQGSDPGVSFISSHDREKNLSITLISNFGQNVWELEELIYEMF